MANLDKKVAKWMKYHLCCRAPFSFSNRVFLAENIVKLLLDNGASSDIVNKRNETPIDCPYNIQV